ncbi:MAG: TraR/DksA family transcriptional regulator [Planctomycetales bacterium]|nr:TraR/DksA family transcriptional regulator [Planctomycetales bacterium]
MAKTGRKESIAKMRDVLIKRRDALRKALAGDLSLLKELQQSGDEIDAALDAAQDELISRLAEVESRELAQIENALERMRTGQYGVCEITGKPIPLARLQALPYATLCIEAQREVERLKAEGVSPEDWGRMIEIDTADDDVNFSDIEADVA